MVNELMLNTALQYYDKGMCILPVVPEQKRPMLGQWQKYTKVRPTRAETFNWFSTLNGCGVGMVTGRISGYIILDIESSYEGDVNQLLQRYPTRMIAKSGSGGYHFYYKYPAITDRPIRNRVQVFPHVDIRADGGFIVLPPTKHPSGGLYEWLMVEEAGEFPKELLTINEYKSDSSDKWVNELLRGVSDGSRNQALARLAGYFYSKGLADDIVESMMFEWNDKNNPPLSREEVITTLKSVQRYRISVTNPVKAVEFVQDGEVTRVKKKFDAIRMNEYFREYGSEGVRWMIQDWLAEKSITFIVAPPESYKTWILMDLAVSVASGMPFLGGAPVYQKGAVLIIQQEDSHAGISERLGVVMASKLGLSPSISGEEYSMPVMPDLPIYIHPDRMLKFADKEVMQDLEKLVQEIKPALILIDPLYSATSMDNYMADSTSDMFQLKRLRDKYGCSFVIAHHSKKNVDPESTAREDGWGSQFLNAFLEAGWQVRRSPKIAPNEVIVRRHSKTMGNLPPMLLHFDISTRVPASYKVTFGEYTATPVQTEASRAATDEVMGVLMKHKGGLYATDIANELNKDRSTVTRKVQKLVAKGLVHRMPDGKIVPNASIIQESDK